MLEWMTRQFRRALSGFPSSATGELHNAWLSEQIRAYATPQPYAGPLTNPNDNWSGETWEMREGYRRYAFKEPSVKSALLTKILAVAQLDPIVIPDDKTDRQSREVAQWAKWAISKMDGGCSALVYNVGVHALVDGFSVTEKVQDQVPDEAPKYAGHWTIKTGKTKDTRGIRFRMDTFKNVVGVRSMIAAQGAQEFDPKDFIIYTHLPLFGNPFGLSDLRAANRAANLIEAAIKARGILLENFSGPYLVGKASDVGARTIIMETLRHARARGWIVIPEGAEIEVINLATSAPDQFQNTIEDLRQEIVTAIQGSYLQLLEGGIADGRGNTQVHKGIAELFQWWLATTISSVINNSLMGDIVRPNYGENVGLPSLQLGGINAAAISAELDRFKKGQELGVKLSAKQVMEIGGFESPEDENDVLTPPQQGQQQQGQPGGNPNDPNQSPDLSDVFGGGDVQVEQSDQNPDAEGGGVGDDAGIFRHNDSGVVWISGVRAFSEAEAELFADRSHLVKKVIRDANGISRTVYVNPNKGNHGTEEQRLAPRVEAQKAVRHAIENRGKLTPEQLADLPGHINTLTTAEKRTVLKQLGLHTSDNKAALAARIDSYARLKDQPARQEGPDSLYKAVRRYGGIDPQSHALQGHFKNSNEAMQNGISLGVFKRGGRGLDQLAKELHATGYIPDAEPETLLSQLKKGAKSSYNASVSSYDKALEDYWAAEEEAAKYYAANPRAKARADQAKASVAKRSTDKEAAGRWKPSDEPIPFADATPVRFFADDAGDAVELLEKAAENLNTAKADVQASGNYLRVLHSIQLEQDADSFDFAEWTAGTSKATGEPGYVSTGGQFRKSLPKSATAKPAEPKAKPDANKLAQEVHAHLDGNPAHLTRAKVRDMKAKLDSLTVKQIQEIKRDRDIKGGKKKAELIESVLATARKLKREADTRKKAEAAKPVSGKAFAGWHESKAVKDFLDEKAGHALPANTIGGFHDSLLTQIQNEAGRGEKPKVGSAAEIDALVKQGWREAFRGQTDPKYYDQFRGGENYAGSGIYGNGIYVAPTGRHTDGQHLGYDGWRADRTARDYTGVNQDGPVMRLAIPPTARTINHDELEKLRDKAVADLPSDDNLRSRQDLIRIREIYKDLGRFAALHNYDCINCPSGTVVLNRSILAVQKENV